VAKLSERCGVWHYEGSINNDRVTAVTPRM
jgi:hypothetical protein